MQDPNNLRVTPLAEAIVVEVYGFIRSLPREERGNLAYQMRRAATSILSNICEGCGKEGNRALLPFLHHSMASASELQAQLWIARRVRVGNQHRAAKIAGMVVHEKRMLSKLIVSIRGRLADED